VNERSPVAAASGTGRSRVRDVDRLALSPTEAAAALGVSRDFFDEHVGPELRWVRRGRLKLVATAEVARWLEHAGELTLPAGRA
jgi:hypothetical protein